MEPTLKWILVSNLCILIIIINYDIFDIGLYALGGVLSDTKHVWQAKGPYLEIRDTKRGLKVGSWTFGCILKDSNTKIIDVKELQKSSGKLSLLAVSLDCTISGGIICLFNIFSSKVIRAIHIKEKVCVNLILLHYV